MLLTNAVTNACTWAVAFHTALALKEGRDPADAETMRAGGSPPDSKHKALSTLAALLGWPQGTFASKVAIEGDTAMVTREVDGGLETLALTLPAVITTDLRPNEPRYASLPNIHEGAQKADRDVAAGRPRRRPTPRLTVLNVSEPPKRQAGA